MKTNYLLTYAALVAAGIMQPTPCQLHQAGPEPDLKEQITGELKKISDQLKEQGEKAMAEAKKGVDMSAETKTKVDEMLVKQGELMARLHEAEQKLDRRSGPETEQAQTAGALMIASPEFKAYVAAGDFRKGFNFPVKAIVNLTSQATSVGAAVAPYLLPGVLPVPDRRLTVRDLLSPGTTGSPLIQYVRETGYQNMAAPVSETTAKPKSDITFELIARAVVKIATYVKASTEILSDAAMLQSYIDQRLRFMLAYAEETQLLMGSGAGNNLHGIYTQATAYSAPIVIAGATKIDTLRLMLLQAELALFPATGIVVHPSDWTAIELTKDTTGNYIFANPQSIAGKTLWGRAVVDTPAMAVDTALVGAFKLGAQIFDRQQANVQVATENEDDFIKNMMTILVEERLALAVYRPEAFIKTADLPAT